MFTNPEQYEESMRYIKEVIGGSPHSSWKRKENVFEVSGFKDTMKKWKVVFEAGTTKVLSTKEIY